MKNPSLLLKLFVAFSLFVIVPILICVCIVQFEVVNYTRRQLSASAAGELGVIMKTFENTMSDIENSAIRISMDRNAEWFDKHSATVSGDNMEDIDQIREFEELLANVVRTNNTIRSVYYYAEDSDKIITSDMTFSSMKHFKDKAWHEQYLQYREADGSAEARLWLVSGNNLCFIFPQAPYFANDGAVVVNLRIENLLSNLDQMTDLKQRGFYLLDENGEEILKNAAGNKIAEEARAAALRHIKEQRTGDDYFTVKAHGKSYLVCSVQSTKNDWRYIHMIEVDDVLGGINRARSVLLVLSVLMAGLGLMLSYLVSKRIYTPVSGMMKELSRSIHWNEGAEGSELELLGAAVNKMMQREQSLAALLENNRAQMKEIRLFQTLEKGFDILEPDVRTEHPEMRYLVIYALFEYPDVAEAANRESIYRIFMSMCMESFARVQIEGFTALRSEEHMVAALLRLPSSEDDKGQAILKGLEAVSQEFGKTFSVPFGIGIGGICRDGEINGSAAEAYQAAKTALLFDGVGVKQYAMLPSREEEEYFYPENEINRLIHCLRLGLAREAEETIGELIAYIRIQTGGSYDNARQILYQLAGEIVKFLLSIRQHMTDLLGGRDNPYSILAERRSLDSVEMRLRQTCANSIAELSACGMYHKKHMVKMKEYIQAHYQEDIGIEDIAAYLSLSATHVRRVFKETTGHTLMHYISRVRVDAAKQILKDTNRLVADVAYEVGFRDVQTFVRSFKKYEGVTPTEYRAGAAFGKSEQN